MIIFKDWLQCELFSFHLLFPRHYTWLPRMGRLNFRTQRNCPQSSETSSIVAWKWMWRREEAAKSYCRWIHPPVMNLFSCLFCVWKEFSFCPHHFSLLVILFLFKSLSWGAASFPEASEAALESHTSHPGSEGGHEGQSLADETSDPADPCCVCTDMCQPFRFCARQ